MFALKLDRIIKETIRLQYFIWINLTESSQNMYFVYIKFNLIKKIDIFNGFVDFFSNFTYYPDYPDNRQIVEILKKSDTGYWRLGLSALRYYHSLDTNASLVFTYPMFAMYKDIYPPIENKFASLLENKSFAFVKLIIRVFSKYRKISKEFKIKLPLLKNLVAPEDRHLNVCGVFHELQPNALFFY